MAITRIGQLTAETRVLTDIDRSSTAAAPSISSAQAHTGTYSYLQSTTSNAPLIGIVVPTPTTAYRVGFWIRHAGLGSDIGDGNNSALYIAANGKDNFESQMIAVAVRASAGNLTITRPASGTANNFEDLATASIPASLLMTDTWIHVGIAHKIAQSDGFLSVYINGIEVLSLAGDTRLFGQGNGTATFGSTAAALWVGGGALNSSAAGRFNNPNYCDDIFFDSYVGEADAAVPARRFDIALPTGAGANAAWTPLSSTNVSNIDDNPNDGDTTYNKALAADLKDTFVYSDITVPTDHHIVAVIPTAFAKRLDSEVASQIRVHAYDGSLYAHSSDLDLSMDYTVPVFGRLTTQPDGSDWNEADFNSSQFGVESRGTF